MTHWALIQGDVDDPVDLLWGGCGPKICGVAFATSGLPGCLAACGPAKGMGLAMGVALRLVELLAKALEFLFQFGDAAIALLTAGTDGTSKTQEVFPKIG